MNGAACPGGTARGRASDTAVLDKLTKGRFFSFPRTDLSSGVTVRQARSGHDKII